MGSAAYRVGHEQKQDGAGPQKGGVPVKRSRRHQKGYVFRKGNFWYLRYRQPELQKDGASMLVQEVQEARGVWWSISLEEIRQNFG
jgi:hypothetical protein